MRYKWLAHHLVHRRFPEIDRKLHNELVSEAICRAWCTFQLPDYRLMQACVDAAARRKGLVPGEGAQPAASSPLEQLSPPKQGPQRAIVIRMADYR